MAAAAISCSPSCLVTWNLKDFDRQELARLGVTVLDPDAFLVALFDKQPDLILAAMLKAYGFAGGRTNKVTWDAYLDRISEGGRPNCLAKFASRLRHEPKSS